MRLIDRLPPRFTSRLIATLLMHACTFAAAQSVVAEPSGVVTTTLHFAAPLFYGSAGDHVQIVTLASPRHRRSCTVATVSDTQVTCSHRLGAPSTFSQQDILAIIAPAHRTGPGRDFFLCEGIAGGVITGAVLLGLLVSFPLGLFFAIPVGLFGVFAGSACGLIANDENSTAAQLLYLRAGQQLPFAL